MIKLFDITPCETCIYHPLWQNEKNSMCQMERKKRMKLGFPIARYDCQYRCREPGSDDDLNFLMEN